MPSRRAGIFGFGSLSGLALATALAVLLAWFASVTPRPLPANAPTGRFAAGRALGDIAALAAVPHPSGSPAAAKVRDGIVARLQRLGLEPTIERRTGIVPFDVKTPRTYAVENVLARLPGRDRAAPALLVMSHYDSVPGSPGAADDMAGVASALEIARLLKAQGPPARDVVFAFTDGEEIGLNGAQALFQDPAASRNIGFVLNMDVRGGGGRAMMFQTGRDAGGAVRLFAAHARQPDSNSLAAFLYEKMPNDTDFSVSLAKGLPGLNYAFIGRPALYHTPAAVPAAVEPGAVQSLGEQVYLMAHEIAFATKLPAATPSPTWFDLFGRAMVVYDPPLGWAPLLVAAALLGFAIRALAGSGELAPVDLLVGVGQAIAASLLATAFLVLYTRLGFIHRPDGRAYYDALAHAGRTEWVAAASVLVAALLIFRGGGWPARPCGRWAGAAVLAWLLALLLQVFAPRAAYLVEWPVLVVAAALLLTGLPVLGQWMALLLCGLALGFLLEAWHAIVLGIGVIVPAVAVALAPLALAALSPWLQREARARTPGVTSALI